MSRVCTICSHPKRKAIDKRVIEGATNREIMERFGVKIAAVDRHKKNHIRKSLIEASEKRIYLSTADRLDKLISDTQAILDKAGEDYRLSLSGIREMRGNLELAAKLRGELQTGTNVNVQTATQINVMDMMPMVLEVLRDFPEALAAINKRLRDSTHEIRGGNSQPLYP
jgi:hypothetical protein